jgi:electron transfer flavoprotein alpha subunit
MACKILVVAEQEGGALRDTSFELLGMAHRLAGKAGWEAADIKALVLGQGVDSLAEQLAQRGASEAIYAEGAAVENYTSEAYGRAIEAVARDESPEVLLMSHTPNGWDLAPSVAGGLEVPVATGCSNVTFEDGKVRFHRKAFNGKFVHVVEIDATPKLATVDKGAATPIENATPGTVRKIDAAIEGELKAQFIEIKKGESGGVDLTQAPIIVAVGRGVGKEDKVPLIQELADALGGQVGASRAVTDAGWLPHEHQIGSSGVTVNPKLYIAAGISGAIQHVVGMKGSGYIISINKDADAPIFGVSDVGVAADMEEIVPALTKAVKEAKGS